MSVLSTTTKVKAGTKVAKAVGKRPQWLAAGGKAARPVVRLGAKTSKPFLKRRARQQAEQVAETARLVAEMVAVYGPPVAYGLGLVEPPKPKRTAPWLAAGAIIGASAVYFLEPEHGREHREKVAQLVG